MMGAPLSDYGAPAGPISSDLPGSEIVVTLLGGQTITARVPGDEPLTMEVAKGGALIVQASDSGRAIVIGARVLHHADIHQLEDPVEETTVTYTDLNTCTPPYHTAAEEEAARLIHQAAPMPADAGGHDV